MPKRIALVIAASAVTVATGVSVATPASGAAAVIREVTSAPFSDTGLGDDCRPGITGDLAGTEVVDSQSVETSTGFRVVGTTTDTGRIDWSDGSYTLVEAVNHFSFTTGAHATTSTTAHEDSGDTYTASGDLLIRDTFHIVERFTVSGGVVRVEFERGRLHVFGTC